MRPCRQDWAFPGFRSDGVVTSRGARGQGDESEKGALPAGQDDPESGQPTQYGRFSRNWQDEEALDELIDQLEAGRVTHKQALMQARKLEATTPYNLEIQNFIANRLWALGLQDEAAEVYVQAFHRAQAQIPMGYTGQITWSEVDNHCRRAFKFDHPCALNFDQG